MLKRENIGLLILIIIVLIMFSGYIEIETLPIAGSIFLVCMLWFVVVIMKEIFIKSRKIDDETFIIVRNWKSKINTLSWLGLSTIAVLIILSSIKLYLLLSSNEVTELFNSRSNIRKLLLLGMLIYVFTKILNNSFRKNYFLSFEDGNMEFFEGGEVLFQIYKNDEEHLLLNGKELQVANPTNQDAFPLKNIKMNTKQFHTLQNWLKNISWSIEN